MLYKKDVKPDNTNDSRSIIFNAITPNSVVLDLGCACGDLADKLVNLKKCTVYGLEYNPESVEKCQAKNIFTEVKQFDLNTLNNQSFPDYTGKFDYIIFGDILEHLLDPLQTINITKNYLKSNDNGKFIISLPNLSHASIKANLLLNDFTRTPLGILDKTHLHFFTYKTIASLLAESKLGINDIFYTTLPFDGYQPHKLKELPKEVADFITNDIHSAIFQYILVCSPQTNISITELEQKLQNLTVTPTKAGLIFKIKRFIMTKCPQLIRYLEKIR